jgi:hypothetical protein
MPKAKRYTRKKKAGQVSDQQLLKDSKKALQKAARALTTELKTVKRYIKALDGHNSFTI